MRKLMIAGAGALAVGLWGGFAFAAGSDTVSEPKCSDGQVYSDEMKKCVDAQDSMLDDESIYEAGRDYAYAERYGEAITVLSTIAAKGDPRVLNYLGYSHRKQGRILVGLGYYEEALRANPDFTLAREYMGEAFLQLGDVDAARGQLQEIAARCGTGCDEYLMLDRQIGEYLNEI